MKKKYSPPSFEQIKFQPPKVLLENSDIFQNENEGIDGDLTVIKPFG